MSVLGVSRLIRDIEHEDGALERLQADPEGVIDGYPVTSTEREAVLALDAARLVELGVNPLLVRTLLILNGVRGPEMYTHGLRLVATA